MFSKDRTVSDGLTLCEATPGHIIRGTEGNHEILHLIQAMSIPKPETRPPNTSCSFCLHDGNLGGERGSEIVAVKSLAAVADEAS